MISLFSIKIAGLQILPSHFAACLLPSPFHNSSVALTIFHVVQVYVSSSLGATTEPPSSVFEGVNQTSELNAFLMSQHGWSLETLPISHRVTAARIMFAEMNHVSSLRRHQHLSQCAKNEKAFPFRMINLVLLMS